MWLAVAGDKARLRYLPGGESVKADDIAVNNSLVVIWTSGDREVARKALLNTSGD